MVNTRIRYFDVAKGLTILCVILSHSAIEAQSVAPSHIANTIISVCFSFHMPLFFILSGYFMHLERDFRWAKEAKQLLCTYLLTSAAVLLGVTCVATIDHGTRKDVLRQWGDAVLYGSGDISDLTLWPVQLRIGAIWFYCHYFGRICCFIFSPGCHIRRAACPGGRGVRRFQGRVRVPQDQARVPDPRLGEGAPRDHGRGWSDGACSRTTRVRLIRGREDAAGSRQPRRPRFHGWDAERETARGHHPGIKAGDGKGVPLAAGRLTRWRDRRVHGRFRSQRRARRQDARQGPRKRCRRERIPWCVPTAAATAGGPDGWISWTATAWHGRRARRAVPRTTPPRRGSSDA